MFMRAIDQLEHPFIADAVARGTALCIAVALSATVSSALAQGVAVTQQVAQSAAKLPSSGAPAKKFESADQPVQAGLARPDTCAAGVTDALGRELEHFGGIPQTEMDCHRGELSNPCASRAGKTAQSHDRMGLTQ
jgi:hypothetical protein